MSRNRKPKKNKQNFIVSGFGGGNSKLVQILGLKNLSNAGLVAILGFAVICFAILSAQNLSPRAAKFLTYPGKMIISSLAGDDGSGSSIRGQKSLKVPILFYHHVGGVPAVADELRIGMTVPTEEFETQAAWLKGQGYTAITLDNLLMATKGKFKLPEKPVIFTFDDGYQDVFDNAVPILQKYGYVGSFGIITQFPGRSSGTNVYASWQAIRNAQKAGMEIVCHTQDHFDGTNPRYDAKFILTNLIGCQQDLVKNAGGAEPIMIYPYGDYNQKYIEQAQKAGFEMALTTTFGKTIRLDKLMEVPRIRVGRLESLESFEKLILE